ncbi:alpha/beta hydrolase family protein [Mycolicibacterium sp. 22603]|uniref:alpha/beta hydrolase family protein n=1 Tax=Mycolicibacterium sp. 22603 TaxID=3453950 RepID=UPI003F8271FC
MKSTVRLIISVLVALLLVAGCSSGESGGGDSQQGWVEDEVSFTDAAGLTIHGTYRHHGDDTGPAALLISESGATDRNGDNAVAGPVGNMRQLAEYLSGKGIASLRYDKVGTGKTGLGPYATNPADVGSAAYTAGARAAVRYLAARPGTDADRISVYALGEGTIHAMTLADDIDPDSPKIHALGLLQPLPGRYLDIVSDRVRVDVEAARSSGAKTEEQAQQVLDAWAAAVEQARTRGTAPAQLPDGLGAILNAGNVKAVVEADSIDPLALAAKVPTTTRVLLTCSDTDGQAPCTGVRPLVDALRRTVLTVVELKGVNHVLRDDPTDNVANYAKQDPLSPQLVSALDTFVEP